MGKMGNLSLLIVILFLCIFVPFSCLFIAISAPINNPNNSTIRITTEHLPAAEASSIGNLPHTITVYQANLQVPAIAPTVAPIQPKTDFVKISQVQWNWKNYCAKMKLASDNAICVNASEKGQVSFLLSILNKSRAPPPLTINSTGGFEAMLLSYYPPSLYEQFGCVNENFTRAVIPGYWTDIGSYRWHPATFAPLNQSDGAQFHWMNLTTNAQTGFEYNDTENNTWNCTWWQVDYTPIIPPSLNCIDPAEADWHEFCPHAGLSCDVVNPQEKTRIISFLANQSQTNQWRCNHDD